LAAVSALAAWAALSHPAPTLAEPPAEKTEKAEKPDPATKTPEKAEPPAKPEKTAKKPEKSEKSEKPEKREKPEKSEKPEPPDDEKAVSVEPARPDQWICVTAPALKPAAETLAEHRRKQGMVTQIVVTTDVLSEGQVLGRGEAGPLRDKVAELCGGFKGLSRVVLLGAASPEGLRRPAEHLVPPFRGTVAGMAGEMTDLPYSLPDAKTLRPTVAVGRLPAASLGEARRMVDKIIVWETDTRPGEWRRRLTVLAGVPNFGAVADAMIEKFALSQFDRLDPVWTARAIYHSQGSRFTVPDEQLRRQAIGYVADGQAVTIYIGHSDAEEFWTAGNVPFMTRSDWARIWIPRGPGFLVTTGCNGCQLGGRLGEGYGLFAVRNPRGPVAVVGGHTTTHPLMMGFMMQEVLSAPLASDPPPRIGDLFLLMKRGLAEGGVDPITLAVVRSVEGGNAIPLDDMRREHQEMMMLLGDPATRFPVMRGDVELTAAGEFKPQATVTVKGACGWLPGAAVRITAERTLTSQPTGLVPVPPPAAGPGHGGGPAATSPERAKALAANHRESNRFVLSEARVTADAEGRFEATFNLPAKLPAGKLVIRAYVSTADAEAMAVKVLP
jgi:hypothetical protein